MDSVSTFKMKYNYLYVTAFVIGSFGPIFFLGTMPQFAEPARWSLDLLAWPLDGMQSYGEDSVRFLSALTGGFLLGWGITVFMLARYVFPVAPEPVRKAVVYGLYSWFVLDSLGSVASGHAANVVFNCIVLLVAVGPLWRPIEKLHQPT